MDQATTLGIPAEFKFKDRIYRVAVRDFQHEAMFCQWVKREAFEELERMKDFMPPMLYKMQIDGYRHDLAMHLYDWGMPFVTSAAVSPSGSKYLALLALAEHNKDVSPLLIDAIYKDGDAWERLCVVMGELNDPNPTRQVQEVAAEGR